ncbi:MAG: response regulator [Firmicutes bacterium]|nr:response regulator [Bacillota bacterium]
MKEILVVEDSSLTRLMVKRVLEEEGYAVTELASGEEVLAKIRLRQRPFDLIIMDIHLPGMDGLRTLEALKGLPEYAYVPVMMLTVTSSAVREAIRLGAVEYLCKPFEQEQLVQRVRKLIGPGRREGQEEKTPLERFYEVMRLEINRARRGSTPLTIVLGRREGGPGAEVRELAEQAQRQLRTIDAVLPLSKRSLVAVLPVTDLNGAQVVMQKLESWIATADRGAAWKFAPAAFPEHGQDGEELLERARAELSKATQA